jgi:hypothetical protein
LDKVKLNFHLEVNPIGISKWDESIMDLFRSIVAAKRDSLVGRL